MDPFFIFYDARSGSTFFSRMIAEKLNLIIPPESNFISYILEDFPNQKISREHIYLIENLINKDEKFSDWKIDFNELIKNKKINFPLTQENIIKTIFKEYIKKYSTSDDLIGIKKDSYINHYDDLIEIFPSSKFIFIIRDGRAIFSSKKRAIHSKTKKPFENNPRKAAYSWCEYLKKAEEIIDKFSERCIVVKYEKLINSSDLVIKDVENFLLTNKNKIVDKNFVYKVPKRYGRIHDNVFKPPKTDRINAWIEQLSEKEIYVYENIAKDYLIKYGYDLVHSKRDLSNYLKRIKYFFG